MCDYSLHEVASRPARLEDRLITSSFRSTSTRGFAAVGERDVAVCLMPGSELAFDDDVSVRWNQLFSFFLGRKESLGRLARFRQIDLDDPHAHHDALEFPNGTVVLLTTLCEGQKATVLQLPAARSGSTDTAAKSRVIDLAPIGGDSWALIP